MINPSTHVVILDDYENIFDKLSKKLSSINVKFDIYNDKLEGPSILNCLRNADVLVLMRDRTKINSDLLHQLTNLKYVIFTGQRNNALDIDYLKSQNIPISCTRSGPSKNTTAELTWALILTSYKRIIEQNALVNSGQIWHNEFSVLPVLHGERLGLIGLGDIGKRVAHIGKAFGCEVVAWSPNLTQERASASGVTYVSLEELMSTSRIVSLHLVPSQSNTALLTAEFLSSMRTDSLLVNTSRSCLIDTDGLIHALKQGSPGQAALDVFDEEPLTLNSNSRYNELRTLPNVIMTPHLGFVSEPVIKVFEEDVEECLNAWLNNMPLVNLIQ